MIIYKKKFLLYLSKEFKFLIANNKADLYNLADKIIKNDINILNKYKN